MALLTILILIFLLTFQTPTVKPCLEENQETVEMFSLESGQDESQKKEALLLDKFRVLLGLGTFHRKKPSTPAPAPAPATEEVEVEGPAPIIQPIAFLHPHRRHRTPRVSVIVAHRGDEKRRARRVLVAVVGGALVVLGVVFACLGKRYYRKRKRCVRSVSVVSNERGKDNSVFYLNALTSVLDPHTTNNVNTSAQGRDKEIVSHSSGDESFHSICESINNASNNSRLSNVSMSSYIDAAEGFSPLSSCPNNSFERQPSQNTQNPPPPPPPPPPLPSFVLHCSPSLGKMKAKSPSCMMQNPWSSESPGSSSRSNETPTSVIPKTPTIPIPPRPPSNIPQPPCPPLFIKGNSPKAAPDFASLGKDGSPLPKLKPLHWDKVRATPDRSMVWDKLRSSSFELDEEMIESLFGYSLKSVFQTDEGKSKTPSPNKHVLEPKRLQNMTILSKALNVSAEQVCEALLQGDGLRLQQLEALAKMEPTKEEETKMSNYKGNINELGSPEKLFKAMLNIPFAFQRIEAMLYKATFEDEVVHLTNSFSMLEEACKELRSSRLFLKLLEAVLKTGNRMNVGTIRGGAKAFKLDALLKLADVKGTDGKTTLLHFVVQEIIKSEGIRMSDSIMGKINRSNKSRTTEEREEDYKRMGLDLVSGLSTELCNVKKTASIDLDVLATSVSNLSDGMAKMQKLVTKDLRNDTTSTNFIGAMKAFISHGETSLRDLQEREAEVLKSVKEITEYFHGEVGKDEKNLLRIFVIVRDFMAMLDQVCRELRSLKAPKTPNPLAPFH